MTFTWKIEIVGIEKVEKTCVGWLGFQKEKDEEEEEEEGIVMIEQLVKGYHTRIQAER